MGKAQSKRSVDITTEGKKDEEVIAGKMEKIEDAEDQKPHVNGDATPPESDAKEKKETEESENDKDATTEKSSADAGVGGGDGGDQAQPQQNGEQNGEKEGENATAAPNVTTPKEETTNEGGEAAAGAEEEISPLADDSSKKTKKEKVKKKWSFRSISFGKKDKQKPAKTDADVVSPTTNGETNDKPAEGATTNVDEAKKEEIGDAKLATENGNASEKELLNGDGGETTTTTTTPTEDKSATVATNNELTNESAVATVAATTNNTTASSSTTTSPSTAPVAAAAAAATVAITENDNKAAKDVATTILSNGNGDDIKNDIALDDKPKLNGTNGQEHAGAEDDEEQTHSADIKAVSKSIEYHNTISFDKKIPTIIEETVTNDGDGDGAGDDGVINNINSNIKGTGENVEDIGAGGDIGETKCEDINVIEEKFIEPPPPLPISPPPSQMVAFALNPELTATQVVENWVKVETAQPTKLSIADLESEFLEQAQIQSADNIEKLSTEIVPNKEFVENISKKINVEEHLDVKQKETLALHEEPPYNEIKTETTEVGDIGIVDADGPKVLAITAAASLMVEEVTVEAAEVVTDMSKELQGEIEKKLTASKYAEDLDVDDDELPPPPPSPPYVQEDFEQCEDSGTVEDVLNQFESKMNEIEQKVMNSDIISVTEPFEMSQDNGEIKYEQNREENLKECAELAEIEEQKQFELCETEMAEPETVENEMYDQHNEIEDVKPVETIEIVEIHEENNKTESVIISEHNDNLLNVEEQNGNETQGEPIKGVMQEIENVTIEAKQNDNETHVTSVTCEIGEETSEMNQNTNETQETPVTVDMNEIKMVTPETEQIDIESHKEQKSNELNEKQNNNVNEEIDATSIIMEQINNLTLNEKINFETTSNKKDYTPADDEACVKDGGETTNKPQLIDFENVKEINPIELKEAAAAAEITTQDLAVSCE